MSNITCRKCDKVFNTDNCLLQPRVKICNKCATVTEMGGF